MKSSISRVLLSGAALFLISCSTYNQSSSTVQGLLESGHYEDAVAFLEPLAREPGKDQLLANLDLGVAYVLSGNLEKAVMAFDLAERLTAVKEYKPFQEETLSIVTSAATTQYRGEDLEKLMINVMWAMSYLLQGNLEDALVEGRKLHYKLYRMKTEGKRPWKEIPLARYLAAMSYEAAGEWDDAYIEYSKTYDLLPGFSPLREDLIRSARKADRWSARKKWMKKFGIKKSDTSSFERLNALGEDGKGELVLIFENGKAPIKVPSYRNRRIPEFIPYPKSFRGLRLVAKRSSVESKENRKIISEEVVYSNVSELIFDLESMAIRQLNEKMGSIVLSRIGGIVAKEIIGHQIGKQTNSPALGQIARIALHVSDVADTRSWRSLPAEYQIVRLRLPEGEWDLEIEPEFMGAGYKPGPDGKRRLPLYQDYKVQRGQMKFLVWRERTN